MVGDRACCWIVGVVVLAVCSVGVLSSLPAEERTLKSCATVKPIFEMKNISADEIPDHPISGADLVVCQATRTCCTPDMEANLNLLVRKDFQALLHHNSRSLQGLLQTTAAKLQEHVTLLTRESENKTESLFNKVYQRIAPLARPAIQALFLDLTTYMSEAQPTGASGPTVALPATEPNLEESVKTFFTELFPLVYHHAVNPHLRDFSPDYKSCLKLAMPEIRPFGDVPRQLAHSVQRALEATRVLLQALELGAEVLNSTDVLLNAGGESDECHTALMRMSYCARCQGLPRSVKPCAGYCLNILRGCLTQHAAELDLPWIGFVEATERLVVAVYGHDRSGATLNVEQVVSTLDSRILEAIMFAMENGPDLEKKVKRTCGQARWMDKETPTALHHQHTTEADPSGPVQGVTLTQGHISTGRSIKEGHQDDSLSTQLHHFLASLTKSRAFYANLAEALCSDESFAETRDTADCWNGKRVGEYAKTVVAATPSAQKYNPELTWIQRNPDARIAQLSDKLRHVRQVVVSQLTLSPQSDSHRLNGEGEEGSGSGHNPSPYWRDEDDDGVPDWSDQGSGSGDRRDPTPYNPDGSNIHPTVRPETGKARTNTAAPVLTASLTWLLVCLLTVGLSNG